MSVAMLCWAAVLTAIVAAAWTYMRVAMRRQDACDAERQYSALCRAARRALWQRRGRQ